MDMVKLSGPFMKTLMIRACSLTSTNWNQAGSACTTQIAALATQIHYCPEQAAQPGSQTGQELKHSVFLV